MDRAVGSEKSCCFSRYLGNVNALFRDVLVMKKYNQSRFELKTSKLYGISGAKERRLWKA
ncbi:hypothetical protein CFP56_010514 [Quercus suber]|uniref:Uncharacterized protein n=1 Tax=Quercus suber TaxID=58331 RepID=A0AAW0M5T6_QUESU